MRQCVCVCYVRDDEFFMRKLCHGVPVHFKFVCILNNSAGLVRKRRAGIDAVYIFSEIDRGHVETRYKILEVKSANSMIWLDFD